MTPEGLGEYLTALVATKNTAYPGDDPELLACGILATITALRQTSPTGMGLPEATQAISFVLQRMWLGWPERCR